MTAALDRTVDVHALSGPGATGDTAGTPSLGSTSRSAERRAQVWQNRFDRLLVGASVTAVAGVALQALHLSPTLDLFGQMAAGKAWLVFAANAAVMLWLVPDRRSWAWSHAFELVVLLVACPLWPMLFADLMLLQLSPALTVLEAAKLAKLAEIARTLSRRLSSRIAAPVMATLLLLTAAAAALLILL